MESGMGRSSETSLKALSSMASNASKNTAPGQQSYFARPGQSIPGFPPFFGPQSSSLYLPEGNEAKAGNQIESNTSLNNPISDWDPQAMLGNLSFLEQKIKQEKDIVQSMSNRGSQVASGSCELAAKQQLATADLTSIIIQLISTAGSMLPSMKSPLVSSSPAVRQFSNIFGSPMSFGSNANQRPSRNNEAIISDITKTSDYQELMNTLDTKDERDDLIKCPNPSGVEVSEPIPMDDHDVKESDDGGERENLPLGSYVVLQLEKEEILAPHTHFCVICVGIRSNLTRDLIQKNRE